MNYSDHKAKEESRATVTVCAHGTRLPLVTWHWPAESALQTRTVLNACPGQPPPSGGHSQGRDQPGGAVHMTVTPPRVITGLSCHTFKHLTLLLLRISSTNSQFKKSIWWCDSNSEESYKEERFKNLYFQTPHCRYRCLERDV